MHDTPLAANSWSLSIGGSELRRTALPTDAVSRKHMMAMAKAPGRREPARSSPGAIGVGRPEGTGAMRATPCSSIDATATRAMPIATATSGPGTDGAKRRRPRSTVIVRAEKAAVVQLMSPRSSTIPRTSATTVVASGSPVIPSTLGSWPRATVTPTPILMPVTVASEMLSMSDPRRSTLAASRSPPTSNVSVARSRAGSLLSVATPAAISVDPVRLATVDVVLTDSVRDPPSSA